MALEVIGPGFGRTGTNSLQIALQQLGFRPCHHMYEVGEHHELLPGWQAAARGEPVDWDDIFAGYRAQTDWPGARYWRELVTHYPAAKVVLTTRDPDEWFDSVQATIAPFLAGCGTYPDAHMNALCEMANETIAVQIFNGRLSDRAEATRIFRDHIDEVRATVPADRLLVFDVRNGWEPLCAFLGAGVPEVPYPRTNSTREFNDRV